MYQVKIFDEHYGSVLEREIQDWLDNSPGIEIVAMSQSMATEGNLIDLTIIYRKKETPEVYIVGGSVGVVGYS